MPFASFKLVFPTSFPTLMPERGNDYMTSRELVGILSGALVAGFGRQNMDL